MTEQKKCARCKKLYPRTQEYFHRNRNSKDGLNSYCKKCSLENQREWRDRTGGKAIPKCLPGYKWCNSCQQCLPASTDYFNRDNTKKDGLCSTCQDCNIKRSRKWYHENFVPKRLPPKTYKPGEEKACTKCGEPFPATPEYFNRDNSQHSGLHPWCKGCTSQKGKDWAEQNQNRVLEWRRQYRQDNPYIYKAIRARRKAKLRNCNGSVSPAEWEAILNYYCPAGQCLACGRKRKLTLDHVLPITKNGKHLSFNVQPLCGRCNSKKHDKHVDYRPDQGRFAMLVYLGNILKN